MGGGGERDQREIDKVGECVVYRDFVAAYNCEGSKRDLSSNSI